MFNSIIWVLSSILEMIFFGYYSVFDSIILSLILLSVTVKIIMSPLEKWGNKIVLAENLIQKILSPQVKEIKNKFKGSSRHDAVLRLHKRYNYNPIYSIRSLAGLLVQLPVFIAAYYMIKYLPVIDGVNVWFIRDLGQPDRMLGGINLLPIIMFAISIFSTVATPEFSLKNQVQAIFVAFCFFILLYNSPAALVIYWVMNNINSLVVNLLKKYDISWLNSIKRLFCVFKIDWVLFPIIIVTVMFFIIPFFMISFDTNEYRAIVLKDLVNVGILTSFEVVRIFIIVFLGIEIVSGILYKMFYKEKIFNWKAATQIVFGPNKLTRLSCYFVLVWVITGGLFFPLIVEEGGEHNLVEIGVNYFHLIYVICIAFVMSLISVSKYLRSLNIFLALLLFVATSSSLYRVYKSNIFSGKLYKVRSYNENSNGIDSLSVSRKRYITHEVRQFQHDSALSAENINIVVVSFDNISRVMMQKVFEENSEIKKIFKDFTFYSKVLSQGPSTHISILGELYGTRPYGEDLNKSKLNYKGISDKLRLEYGNDILSKFYHFTNPYDYIGNKPPVGYFDLDKSFTHSSIAEFETMVYSLMRVFSNMVSLRSLKRSVMGRDSKEHLGRKDFVLSKTIFSYHEYLKKLTVKNGESVIHRSHWDFSHSPFVFDENCVFRGYDKEWYRNNQNPEGCYNLTICVLKEMNKFLIKLKELGVYDNTLIVFKSDHGVYASNIFDDIGQTFVNKSDLFGVDRYRPFLMIKDVDTHNKCMAFNNRTVILNDLARTILLSMGRSRKECATFPGIDLLGREPIEDDSIYYLYMNKIKGESGCEKSYIEIEVPSRKMELYDILNNDPRVILTK